MKKWFRAALNLKHLICIIVTISFLIVIIFLTSESLVSLGEYRSFLSSRNYNYSVIIDKDIEQDTYAFYNKTITFDYNNNLINSIVLMETQNTHTENNFLEGYNLSLEEFEIAISANIAEINKIKIGSIIQSKSKVTNIVNNYKVKMILPDIYGIAETDDDRSKGIIVVGKSEEYLDNIVTNYIYFYKDDYSLINSKGANIVGELNNIDSIKSNITQKYFSQLCITMAVSILISSLFFIVILSFNKAIYLKKKEFGLSNLYNQIKIDILIYSLSIILTTMAGFAISSIFIRFSLVLLLIEIVPFSIISISSYLILKKNIKRR